MRDGVIIHGQGSRNKGITKRSPREELALRVRIMNGRHIADALQKMEDELAGRAKSIGPIDMSRNPLKAWSSRIAQAYLTPPLVDDLTEDFAKLLGDMTARTTIERYAKAGGRPMPTRMAMVSAEVLLFKAGCNFAGELIGWGPETQRPYFELITPDNLEVDYRSDDPMVPTVIRHFRIRNVGGQTKEVTDVYDLTDLNEPSYRIMDGVTDITADVLGHTFDGDDYWWRFAPSKRYPQGRPFHRIIIQGNPREPFRGTELAEGTLTAAVRYTHLGAGIRDAGHPRTHAIGISLDNADSDATDGQTGADAGPEIVHKWHYDDNDRPGSLVQHGPGFDPEVTGKAIRAWELGLTSSLGLNVDFESTGGEPTETERKALAEIRRAMYPEARGHDAIVFRRAAAIHNRMSEATEDMEPANLPEAPLACLYREEVDEALTPADADGDGFDEE